MMLSSYKNWRINNLIDKRANVLLEISIQGQAGNLLELYIEQQKLQKIEDKLIKLGW